MGEFKPGLSGANRNHIWAQLSESGLPAYQFANEATRPQIDPTTLAKGRRSATQIIQETMANRAEFIPPAPPTLPPQRPQA